MVSVKRVARGLEKRLADLLQVRPADIGAFLAGRLPADCRQE
jgi:hypothetical protein